MEAFLSDSLASFLRPPSLVVSACGANVDAVAIDSVGSTYPESEALRLLSFSAEDFWARADLDADSEPLQITALGLSDSQDRLAVGCAYGHILMVDMVGASWKRCGILWKKQVASVHWHGVQALCFAQGGAEVLVGCAGGMVYILSSHDGAERGSVQVGEKRTLRMHLAVPPPCGAQTACFAAAADTRQCIQLFDHQDLSCTSISLGTVVRALAFSSAVDTFGASGSLAAGSNKGLVLLISISVGSWNIHAEVELCRAGSDARGNDKIRDVAFTPRGEELVVACKDASIYVIDGSRASLIRTLDALQHAPSASSGLLSVLLPEAMHGKILALCGDGSCHAVHIAENRGESCEIMPAHEADAVRRLVFVG